MAAKSDKSREIRVFISSTFLDLYREREYLVKMVFPEIRHLCRERGIIFTEIDLRWGLTYEDSSFGRVISTCLQEIDRCRPFFIGILGSRYGWVPDFHDIHKNAYLMEEHVWLEEAVLDGLSLVEMEFNFGVLNAPVPMDGSFFYIRDPSAAIESDHVPEEFGYELKQSTSPSLESEKLSRLRDRVLAGNRPTRNFASIEELGKLVRKDLLRAIKEIWPEERDLEPMELERRQHEMFAMSRRQAYIARQETLRALNDHVMSDAQPLILSGESGIGKSALLAYWSRFFEKRNPGYTVLTHFVGSVSTDTGHEGLIRRILAEARELIHTDDVPPTNPAELPQALIDWLARIPEKKFVIAIDALNQLDSHAAELDWLPDFIPPNVRIIVSTTPGKTLDALRKRGWPELALKPFSIEERESLISRFLSEYRKSLSLEQCKRIAEDDKSASPLFLRTMLEELRLFGEYERIDERIDHYLAAKDIGDLFMRVLERMESDFGASAIRDIMTLIWSSRQGLTEHELLELTPLTRAQFSQTLFALEYHLSQRQGLISFFHDYLRRAVERRYLGQPHEQRKAHERLAESFAEQHLSQRKAYEYPWQLRLAEDWHSLKDWLTNIPAFVEYCNDQTVYDYTGYWLSLKDRYEIVKSYADALELFKARAKDTLSYAKALVAVGKFFDITGNYQAAADVFRTALESYEERFGGNSPETAEVLTLLGIAMQERGDYRDAAPVLDRALSIYEQTAPESEQLARSLDNVATLHYYLGNYETAEQLLRRALRINENRLGQNNLQTLQSLGNLGAMLFGMGKLEEAKEIWKTQAAGIKHILGTEHPEYGAALINLGVVLFQTNEKEEAAEMLRTALAINERLLGPEHPSTAYNLQNLARVLGDIHDYAAEEDIYKRVIALNVKVLGANHPETARNRMHLAGIAIDRDDFDTGEMLLEDSLSTLEAVLGPNNSDTIRAYLSKANLYRKRGEFEEALVLYEANIPKLTEMEHYYWDLVKQYDHYLNVLESVGDEFRSNEVRELIANLKSKG